ncbi:MAG: hypothetical protein ABI591_11960 [Kofleriaceae bacterium]
MDLEILEALALSDDRTAARATLLPGSEDHDYFTCLHAQHRGALDDADQIIATWQDRHGHNASYRRLQLRQLMYRVVTDPDSAADELRDRLHVQHGHEADVAAIDPSRPTRLAPGAFDGAALVKRAFEYSSDLAQVTAEGLYELFDFSWDATRRRVMLSRLSHTPAKQLAMLVAADLDQREPFGPVKIHGEMTRAQLEELAVQRKEVRGHGGWIEAMVLRLRPQASVDLALDREAREAYLVELWAFVSELAPATNSLKAHVLWHLLDTQRRRDAEPDRALFAAYVQLPRSAGFALRRDNVRNDELVQAADYARITGLPLAGGDEELVRDLLQRQIGDADRYANWLDDAWLRAVIAETHLLAGTGDPDRATRELGPARAAAVRERIELAWCVHNRTRFGTDEPVVLEVDVKHVPELVVNVFRVDPLAYFQHHRKEVGVDLDLDGLAASHELVLRYPEPPVRRVRRRIALAMCARPGTYVIDLIGNGISSRAVIHKGRLRHVARAGAAGTVVVVLDEVGRELAGARAWVGEREYIADDRGSFTVPFSTTSSTLPMLLIHGDLAQVERLQLATESYSLELDLALDRQQLTAGRAPKAIARVQLKCGEAPASLALLERTTWDITLTDRHGVATTKSQPLALVDHEAAVLELPLGDDVADVRVVVRGTVKLISEQRDQALATQVDVDIATMYATNATEALYLARTAAGYVISALGKSGEPRAQRPVSVVLVHHWARLELTFELATDARGRIELGELPGVQRITATLGSSSQTWTFGDPDGHQVDLVAEAGKDVLVAVPATRTTQEVIRRMSLVEVRAHVPQRHVTEAQITALESALRISGLAAGEYHVRGPGISRRLIVVGASAVVQQSAVSASEVVELSPRGPAILELSTVGALKIVLDGATAHTRVHVTATGFVPAPAAPMPSADRPRRSRRDAERAVTYVSGRELGDEYRYVLDRRTARRYPGLLLDKPSLLLDPWARRATTTGIAEARRGRGFASPIAGMARGGPSSSRAVGGGGSATDHETYVGYDFLAEPPIVLANLVAQDCVITIPLADLGRATAISVHVDDPAGHTLRTAWLAEPPLAARDLRLRVALDPDRHAMQKKLIASLRSGDRLEILDLATAKVHLIDSLERAHAYLLALRDDPTLREFAWITRWHAMDESERRERYSKHACHELHLFLYFKDRAFFEAVVQPHLAHKRTKTFIDHWLLENDVARYLEPSELAKLNAFELALLDRRLRTEPALVRILADQVAVLPPDPTTDMRLVDALLGAATLEGANELSELQANAFGRAEASAKTVMLSAPGAPPPAPAAAPQRSRAASPKAKKEAPPERDEADAEAGAGEDLLKADLARRQAEAPMFRAADTTQELAEHNWWHRTPIESRETMILPNRLWLAYARHESGSFLSPWLGLAMSSFAEAMCALAVIDLPFMVQPAALVADGPKLTITAAGNALVGTSQLVDGPLEPIGAPLVVGQSYVRADDRHQYVDGEQVDKYVTGPFAAGVVYTGLVVVANPTSTRQRVAALVQIPRGSIAVGGALATQTIDILLEPYGTHGHEYSFYFPTPGRFAHFPVHVSRLDHIVAAPPNGGAGLIAVTAGGAVADPTSWAHVSQHGTLEEVVGFLDRENLAAIDLSKLLWRLRQRDGFVKIITALERRRVYDSNVWGYALLHRDPQRIRAFLRAEPGRIDDAGPVLEMIGLDAEDEGGYEHLEFAPLTNARAHKLGPKLRILNSGLAAQYTSFLELVAHRPAPTQEDLLAATSYFAAQDRVDALLYTLGRVQPQSIAERMQYDYLAAYAACLAGEPMRARELVMRWRDNPVDRWRTRFAALAAMIAELDGAATTSVDPQSRDQQQGELAARQPTFELAVDRDGVVLQHQHVAELELRYFEMDVELLFSRQPFVQSDVSRFSFIEPGHRERVALLAVEQRVPWPAQLRGKNVVVEAVGAGLRKAKIHYANDLVTHVASQYGQVRVQRASDRGALAATYVKVYARQQGGAVTFYKDGYTDLRGWFDYATLSTDELDRVERFAILVASDRAGSAILEAGPPPR